MSEAMMPPLLQGEHSRKIWFHFYLMDKEFNENWQEWIDFYDCGDVFENGYTPSADDATEGVKATHRTRTASAKMLLRKHMSASV